MPLKDLLFGFEGRLRRRDWWIWSIALGIVYYAASDISAALLGLDAHVFFRGGREAVIGDPLAPLAHALILSLAFLWPSSALTAKRAHDRGASAWPPVLVNLACQALSFWPTESYGVAGRALDNGDWVGGSGLIAGLIIVAASLYLVVVLGFLDGTPGPNRFGRSPKGIGGDPADKAAEVFS